MADASSSSRIHTGKVSERAFSPILVLALLLGIFFHLAGFFLFRVLSSPLPAPVDSPPFLEFVSSDLLSTDSELDEYSLLFDSAPLFIPTEWNAAQSISLSQGFPIRETFADFSPRIDLINELRRLVQAGFLEARVESPSAFLSLRFWRFFQGFGSIEKGAVSLADPIAVAMVSILSRNKENLDSMNERIRLPVSLTGNFRSGLSRPAVFYVDNSRWHLNFLHPVLAQSSGDEAFDQAVNKWLREPSQRNHLPTGYLEISVLF